MLTNERDQTKVYPTQPTTSSTEPQNAPRTGRSSLLVRAGIVVTAVAALLSAGLILSALLAGSAEFDIASTAVGEAEVVTTDPEARVSNPSAAEDAEADDADADDATEPEPDAPVGGQLTGADVPAELAPAAQRIEVGIQQLEPEITTVLLSQDVVDALGAYQPIDPEAVLVSSCTDTHCWIWPHGDSLELRFSVTRDSGTMLLVAAE